MAGDWIKMQTATPDKPEVMQIARAIGVTQEAAFGHLFRVWSWADQQSLNGHALNVTENDLDVIARHAGVATAMREVGWLGGENGHLSIPNFDRHNGESSKKRALASDRKRTQRSRQRRDTSVTREEKRREDKKEKKGRGRGPTEPFTPKESTRAWAEKRGFAITWDASLEYFNNYRAANGKSYVDLDQAFENALSADWGDLRKKSGARNIGGTVQSAPPCAHCTKPITGGHTKMSIGKVCDKCRAEYMDGKWK